MGKQKTADQNNKKPYTKSSEVSQESNTNKEGGNTKDKEQEERKGVIPDDLDFKKFIGCGG